jgi:hypothetical protein
MVYYIVEGLKQQQKLLDDDELVFVVDEFIIFSSSLNIYKI